MNWTDKRVFVTGASGFLGGWLVKKLIAANADVVCLLRDWTPGSALICPDILSSVNVISGDITDQPLIERILGEYEVGIVFHLAAQTIVTIANRNPISTFNSNIGGTWAVLEACRRSPRVKAIVTASSDKAYGAHDNLPYTEDTPLKAVHPYDVSKSCADLIAQSYASTWGLPVAITRCGNFYGGGDLNWNRIVPGTIRSVIRGEMPVIRSDGKMIRDYLYIEDAAEAYMLLAESLYSGDIMEGEAFNFSNEEPYSVESIANYILVAMGSILELDIRNEAHNEIPEQYLSSQKAHELLGWQASHSIFSGLKKTIKWYRDYFNG